MIYLEIANSNPYIDFDGFSFKAIQNPIVIKPPQVISDFCYCRFECPYTINVFATAVGSDEYKNDKIQLKRRKLAAGDTVKFELWTDTEKKADLNDNTFGTFYNGFDAQPLYVFFDLQWKKVQNAFGNGIYKIKTITKILGETTTEESPKFSLQEFSDILADGTVKFETWQTGNIISSDFDYTNLIVGGWKETHRINGQFGWRKTKRNEEKYLNSQYEIVQNKAEIVFEYEFQSELVTSDIANYFYKELNLANKILITDYNLRNAEKYTKFAVNVNDISDAKYFTNNRKTAFKMTFSDRKENNIKRNF